MALHWPIETRVELPDWEKDPREVWCQTEQRNPLGVELQREWGRQERPDDEWIEDFVLRFTAACLESGDGSASRERERPKRRNGRAGEKRRRYADTLELFKRCPARLGDLVRRNDPRSLVSPGEAVRPPADAVREAYQKLWGIAGRYEMIQGAAARKFGRG